ncbi:MAG: hypothetical protein QGF42_08755, partial [Acidimicrobiales bacterium]|nr:hypothetical protein [Acidimicrobiales bacterium]
MRRFSKVLVVALTLALIASACGSDSDDDGAAPAATTAAPAATTAAPAAAPAPAERPAPGSLGVVEVGPGEAIQIRSLNAISGDVAFLGIPNENGIRMAVEDYGQIGG